MFSLLLIGSVLANPKVNLVVENVQHISGEEIAVKVINDSGKELMVPVCDTVQVEVFDVDTSRWIPFSKKQCSMSGEAMIIGSEARTLVTSIDVVKFSIARLVLVYGYECKQGLPIELAGCKGFGSTVSGNLSISPK